MPKRLVYLLDTNSRNELTCTVFATAVMKRDCFSETPFTDVKQVMRQSKQIELSDTDRKIVMGLATRANPNEETTTLYGTDSWELVKTLLETKKAFWAHNNHPAMTIGTALPGKLHWQELANGQLQPAAFLEQGKGHMLATTPPAYFNAESNQIGPLSFAAPGTAVTHWITTPAMPVAKAHQWFYQLVNNFPDASLPSPPQLDVDHLRERPQPVITVTYRFADDPFAPEPVPDIPATRLLPVADAVGLELRFAYGAQSYHWDNRKQKTAALQQGTLTTIQRDFEFEREVIEKMAEIGITPEDSKANDGWLSFKSQLFRFPQQHDATFATYLQAQFQPMLEHHSITLHDPKQLLLPPEEGELEIEIDAHRNGMFNLFIKCRSLRKPIDMVQLLKTYLKTLPDLPLEALLADVERQTFSLIENESKRAVAFSGKDVAQLIRALIEIIDSGGDTRLALRQAVQIALELDNDNRPETASPALPPKLLHYLQSWRQQPIPSSPAAPSQNFKATLRPYQAAGLAWLQRVSESGYGGILADEMGLGKTVQTLALLDTYTEGNMPSLLVVPSSLVSTWQQEAEKFAPHLKTVIQHGGDRAKEASAFAGSDLVITTYPLIIRDIELYRNQQWQGIVLDEAHFIKNERTQTFKAISQIMARWRLCLTGTPVENSIQDLYTIFEFTVPGYLGPQAHWKAACKPTAKSPLNPLIIREIRNEIAPFILRRTKDMVLNELPPLTETIVPLELQAEEREAYSTILAATDLHIRAEIERRGLARSSLTILNCLMRLRQCCCDLQLIESFDDYSTEKYWTLPHSSKTQYLLEWLPDLLKSGHKVLIFSSFAQYLRRLSKALKASELEHSLLTGSTLDRDAQIQSFRKGEVDIFLLSLKAGGVGLTLTEADCVIHCDPWWNPAAEAQASARIHRIGQEKPVFVYKIIAENTIESRILAMQAAKRSLADNLLSQDEPNWKLDESSLAELLQQ